MVTKNEAILKEASRFYSEMSIAGKIISVKEELQLLSDILQKKHHLAQMIALTSVTVEEKLEAIKQETGGLSTDVERFIYQEVADSHVQQLFDVIDVFLSVYHASKIEVITAIPISRKQTERIARAFQKKVCKEYDVWINTVDPQVLGGVLVKTSDRMIDGTILNRLKTFEMEMKQD